MDFRILGPLEARDETGPVKLAGGKQKALLAVLLLHAGRVVPIDRLVDDLWGDEVPESAPKMVQILVSQLRKRLPQGLLRTRAPGYVADLDGHSLDLRRFEELTEEGRRELAEGHAGEAAAQFREALALWRGPALAEFEEPFAQLESSRLEEQRLACLEERIEAELVLGRHPQLVAELDALVRRHAHRERLRGQLMLALYRSGRHAEALEAFQTFRRMLADELGIDPPPRLRELEGRMLRQDPSLDHGSVPRTDDGAEEPVAPLETPDREPTTICPSCGAEAPAAARFCPTCGAALGAAGAPEEMLRLVTVLFADVVESTARAETRHPEDVRALMTEYFEAMKGEIEAEGGAVEKFVGDAVMAVFGIPTAREDDAVRAVRASVRMLERLRVWNAGRDPAEQLEIRIGASTGDVVAGEARQGDLGVTGDVVNVAARLQQAAEPGTIVIADRTARAARSRFELTEIDEPLVLRGRSEPVAAWLVDSEREATEPRGVPGLEAPLVGRDEQLASLRASFDRVDREGHPELVTLIGDAGIGKSRLVTEFLVQLDTEARVLIGRCLPYGQGATLWPLAEMLKAEAVVLDTDRADAAWTKIAHLVDASIDPELAGDSSRTAAALASTLGLRPPDDALGSVDPRDLYRELIVAWRALLASIARRDPLVFVVEDLHWADPTMLDVLDELAERLDGPILFLCTARPDLLRSRPDWGGGHRSFSALPLDPLSSDEGALLVSHLLEVDALPDGVRGRILERSEGNPFFLEEIVRHLIDEGSLVREDGRWRARGLVDTVEIPDSVQAAILARLDLLSPGEKRVAQRAAVVGRVFWDGAVGTLAQVDDLDGALRTLRRREFVLERLSSSIAGQAEFTFKHVLVRDVAYESLPRRERGRAHAEAAAWIERTMGDRAGELAELLAHHYDAAFSYIGDADLRRKAREQYLAAAATAHRRFAIEQGERFARRAVELSEPGADRVEALEALGDLHYLAFLGDDAWRTYGEALAELPDEDPAFARLAGKAAFFGARFIGTMDRLPEIEEVHRLIDAGLRAASNPSRERVILLVDRGFLLAQRELPGNAATEAAVHEAASSAEQLGDPNLLSAALDLTQAWDSLNGRYGHAYRTALKRLELTGRVTDVKEIGDAYAMAAWTAEHLGHHREAEEYAGACIERSRDVDRGSYLHGLVWRVNARFARGDWDGAMADQAEIERVAGRDRRDLPAGFSIRGYAYAALWHELRGEGAAADPYIELTGRYFEQRRRVHARGFLHAPPLALTLARRGRFDEAIALIPLVPHSTSAAFTLEALCEIAAARERWDEVAELTAAAREEVAVGEQLSLPLFVDRLQGRAAAAAGDAERAAELLARSAQGFAALEARWEEAWSRLLLAEVLAGADRGPAEREVTAALAVFEELGSVREAERARELLAGVAS
jgi:class 3 adenylate cyclase/DNA-binding SARP family transcriptional activator